MHVASTIVARAWCSAELGVDLAERDRAGHRCTQSMAPAGDGDGGPFQDREVLERGLAKPGQAAIAGDAQVDGHDALANQAVSQVSGNVGFAFTGVEVAAGGLDGQAQGSTQLAEPLPLEHRQLPPQRRSASPSRRTCEQPFQPRSVATRLL